MGTCNSNSRSSASGAGRFTTDDQTVMVVSPHTIRGGYSTDREFIDKVLDVKAEGNGEIILSENYGEIVGGSRKYPVKEYSISGASIITNKNYKEMPEDDGINWENVKVVKGKTYGIGTLVKPKGFVWNGEAWVRK